MGDYQNKLAEAIMADEKDRQIMNFIQGQKVLPQLQANAQYGTSASMNDKQSSGGARFGYGLPLGPGFLNAGIGVSGFNAKGDGYKQHNFGINNLDAAYSWDDNTIGGNINPETKDFNVFYQKRF